MRIFVAGASGVIGRNLVPLMVADRHWVAGMTRSPDKADLVAAMGAEPVVCDVYDLFALRDAVATFDPDLVMHQLTDLPDDAAQIPERAEAHARMLRKGTANLLDAAAAAGVTRVLAQSIAWEASATAGARADLEQAVLDAGGVVVRYGQLYGPDTYYPVEPPDAPRIHVADAARRTLDLLEADAGIYVVADD